MSKKERRKALSSVYLTHDSDVSIIPDARRLVKSLFAYLFWLLALMATAGIIAVLGLWLTVADSRRTRGQAVTA